MKKYNIYFAIIASLSLGIVLGRLFFSQKHSTDQGIIEPSTSHAKDEVWTCSMHPQIRQNEPGDCPICGMDLIPTSQASSDSKMGFQMTEDAIHLANIQTTIIGKADAANITTLKLNGKIEANETNSANLVTHIPGRIEKLYVSYTGEQVKKGEKIATVYSPELITAQRELLEAQKIQDISPGLLSAAIGKLKYWKIGDHVIQSILNSGKIQESFDIYADHSGVVKRRRISVGHYLSTGEVLFDVQDLKSLWAIFDVYENDLPKVKEGSTVSFTTASAPHKNYTAKITFINPVINPDTRAATIRAEIKNSNEKLKPEMFITGELNVFRNLDEKLVVPKSAVLWTGKRSVVYVKNPNTDIPSFAYREIEIGNLTTSGYTIVNGLSTGEEVVTNGAFVIDASSQLNNQASMMNNNVVSKNTPTSQPLPDYTKSTTKAFQSQIAALASSYLPVKNALVRSDGKKAAQASKLIISSLDKVDMTLIKGEPHLYWMKQLRAIQTHGEKIAETEDIEEQRRQFDYISQAIINSLKVFGLEGDTFYVQHCPMANNNQGAQWISKEDEIINPYFGDAMLSCGTVQDTLHQF